uniref:Uncharacterized protein n=1 Tax=Amphilophus citrinellus TaxID=61819 RepID=A0A3Q0T0U9_AMPCI
MVLQKSPERAVLWGYGPEGAQVTVSLSGLIKQQTSPVTVTNGIWRVTLDLVAAGGPYNVTENIQNSSATLTDIVNPLENLALVAKHTHVRPFTAARNKHDLIEVEIPWSGPTTTIFFFFFFFVSVELLKNVFSGEFNAIYNQKKYNCSFSAMLDDCRMLFHQSSEEITLEFPFGFVQLSTCMKGSKDDSFPNIRWHQTADFGFVPNIRMKKTFMPDPPQDVAYRLTLGARAVAYDEKVVTFPQRYSFHLDICQHYLKPGGLCHTLQGGLCSKAGRAGNDCRINRSVARKCSMWCKYLWAQLSATVRQSDWPCDFKAQSTAPVRFYQHLLLSLVTLHIQESE